MEITPNAMASKAAYNLRRKVVEEIRKFAPNDNDKIYDKLCYGTFRTLTISQIEDAIRVAYRNLIHIL
jgi:hypothetical protein